MKKLLSFLPLLLLLAATGHAQVVATPCPCQSAGVAKNEVQALRRQQHAQRVLEQWAAEAWGRQLAQATPGTVVPTPGPCTEPGRLNNAEIRVMHQLRRLTWSQAQHLRRRNRELARAEARGDQQTSLSAR